ncbi:MAG: BPSS1780 family membrane protein [Azospira sp.]|jgi:hypothetical protein|nr:BPSS1780 family membrane protein [Azospira sp.]
MQVLKLTARQGWGWLAAGFSIFRRNPSQLMLVVIAYWLIVAFVNSVPLAGPALATISIPFFSVGLMSACRDTDRGRPQSLPALFAALFSGFSGGWKAPAARPLLTLGVLYLAASLLALFASSLVDGGLFMQTMLGGHQPSEADLAEGTLVAGAQAALLLMAPVIMAWWYAPVLVAWHGFGAGKALFFSFAACLRNWPAFLAYGACVTVFCALLPGILLGFLFAALGAPGLVTLFVMPLLLMLGPTLVASGYVSYRDVFVATDVQAQTTLPPPADDD